jgi:hypothetical protein
VIVGDKKKPPLGLLPRLIWIDKRQTDILNAMNRYILADMLIPVKWVEEYNLLIKELNDENKRIGKE